MIFDNFDRIVFAGDSVTDMDRAKPLGEGLFAATGRGFVAEVETFINAFYPEMTLRFTNAGISGNTSRELLARFETDVTALKPQWISICIGINDVWRQFDSPAMTDYAVDTAEYEKNLRAMIESSKATAKGVIVCTPYYMEANTADFMRCRMQDYVDICTRLAAEYDCIFVDFQKMYDRYFQYKHSSFIAWDRVHPNQTGAKLMAKEWLSKCGFDYSHNPEA